MTRLRKINVGFTVDILEYTGCITCKNGGRLSGKMWVDGFHFSSALFNSKVAF